MTIKEVEKETGLTAKSIRFYESKGLISVEREKNGYRDYTQKDIERLKWIRLLRYLEFNVKGIQEILEQEEADVKRILKEQAEKFGEQNEVNQRKQNIALSLAKDYGKEEELVNTYHTAIDFLEDETIQSALFEISYGSLTSMIAQTLIFGAPIMWLFINIQEKKWSMLTANAVIAIICTILLWRQWTGYLRERRKHKEQAKNLDKGDRLSGLFAILLCVLGIAGIVGIMTLHEWLLAPEEYLFYEMSAGWEKIILFTVMATIILLVAIVLHRLHFKRAQSLTIWVELWDSLGKWKVIPILTAIGILYCSYESCAYVTEDKIICHTPLHPQGYSYSYEDVDTVDTGFGKALFAWKEYKQRGNFYYTVTFTDGRSVTFSQPSTNEEIQRYNEDTYLELEEFDATVMKGNVEKISDDKYSDACLMDQRYIDRFLRIIHNK